MNDLIEFLTQNPICFFATTEKGKPRVRPIGFQFFENGKFFFITSNQKEMWRQITETPYVEFSSVSKDMTTLRVRGDVAFSDDIKKKEKALLKSPSAQKIYKSAENPQLELLYVHSGEAIIFDLPGNKKKALNF
ncbi:pyridoxamine 5'-phosphate oxidase family protein [bacterium]|nr:pyridoxamine 5'-phosphate oxidase family protein [bacterium]